MTSGRRGGASRAAGASLAGLHEAQAAPEERGDSAPSRDAPDQVEPGVPVRGREEAVEAFAEAVVAPVAQAGGPLGVLLERRSIEADCRRERLREADQDPQGQRDAGVVGRRVVVQSGSSGTSARARCTGRAVGSGFARRRVADPRQRVANPRRWAMDVPNALQDPARIRVRRPGRPRHPRPLRPGGTRHGLAHREPDRRAGGGRAGGARRGDRAGGPGEGGRAPRDGGASTTRARTIDAAWSIRAGTTVATSPSRRRRGRRSCGTGIRATPATSSSAGRALRSPPRWACASSPRSAGPRTPTS